MQVHHRAIRTALHAVRCILAITPALCTAAPAQPAPVYPAKPVRVVVASGPGGSTDGLARILGDRLQAIWNHPVVYDNRPGAGGILAGELAARATPDGYTLLFSTSAAIAVSVSLYRKVPYDPVKDFAPIVLVARQPYMLIANASSVSSVKELIATARAKPGQIGFAHTGAGTGTHLAGELFMRRAQVKLLSVPYKSIGQSITAVVSGEVPLTFTSVFSAYTQVKSGKARALAVTGKTRSPAAPEVPTMAEAGLPNYESGNWYGVLAPVATPRAVVTQVNAQINALLERSDVRETLVKLGYEPAGGSPDEFARFIRSEIAEYAALVKSAGLHAE
jgi:tripartite-type tricarboxylate transporter receptor subunit TctC